MRDGGITGPGVKAALAAALALLGAAAAVWSAAGPAPGLHPAPAAARAMGIVAAVAGALAAANYLYAWILVRRLRRGEGVIAAWTVAPAAMAAFRESERARRRGKNNWRGWRGEWPEGLPVIFGHDAVVGETWFRLRARGISRFTHVHIEQGAPPAVQFALTLTVHGAGTQGRTARYRGHLRVPVAEGAEVAAARVVEGFLREG